MAEESNPVIGGMGEKREFWAWFLSLGIAFIILGLISFIYSLTATFSTLSLFGWLLLISGVFELAPSFRTGAWGYSFYLLDALFRVVAGFLFIFNPAMGLVALKVVLASFLVVVGLSRAIGSGKAKFANCGWAVFSGILTTILGLIAIGWSSFWFAGFAIGIDLIFDGVAMIAFGTGLHGTIRRPGYRPA